MPAPTVVTIRPGVTFTPTAAASFRRAETALGRRIGVNSTYRDYNQQMSMYRAWNAYVAGVGPHPGHARAIHPDLSKHCLGLALDSDDWATPGFINHMAGHGWIRTAPNDPTERHHFEYQSWRDTKQGGTAGGGVTPLILEQEEEDMIDSMFAVVDGVPSWCWMNWATGKLYAVYTQKDADWIGKYMGSINPDFVFNGADGGDLYKNKLAMFKLLTGAPATVDVAALAKELSPLLSGIDETALATALAAALEPEFAAIHANIDDQPTEFKITPN